MRHNYFAVLLALLDEFIVGEFFQGLAALSQASFALHTPCTTATQFLENRARVKLCITESIDVIKTIF